MLVESLTRRSSRARMVRSSKLLSFALSDRQTAQEIATLRKEAQAFSAVREALRSQSDPSSSSMPNGAAPNGVAPNGAGHANGSGSGAAAADPARLAFDKVFNADIKNLLSMADMWRTRAPPVPLDFDGIAEGTFVLEPRGGGSANANAEAGSSTAGKAAQTNGANGSGGSAGGRSALKDQKDLSLQESLVLFVSRYELLFETELDSDKGWQYTSARRPTARRRRHDLLRQG